MEIQKKKVTRQSFSNIRLDIYKYLSKFLLLGEERHNWDRFTQERHPETVRETTDSSKQDKETRTDGCFSFSFF